MGPWSLQNRINKNILLNDSLCYGLAMDDRRFLYLADSDRLDRNGDGIGYNAEKLADHLNTPDGLSFNQHGNFFVADRWRNQIQRFSIE
jgi:hypothetical protein